MKLHKTLTLNGNPVQLVREDVNLFLTSPGAAVFHINHSEVITGGIVQFSAGYDAGALVPIFTGVIHNSYFVDRLQQAVYCRELTSTLNRIFPLALRNCTLADVLAVISKETSLKFVTPEQDYARTPVPVFYSVGGGYHLMDSLARIFRIPKPIWQQQGDGKIYVGSWDHSFFAGRPVPVPVEVRSKSGIANSARLVAAPRFRPGVVMDSGEIITKVQFTDAQMQIDWEKNPWGTRWKLKSTT